MQHSVTSRDWNMRKRKLEATLSPEFVAHEGIAIIQHGKCHNRGELKSISWKSWASWFDLGDELGKKNAEKRCHKSHKINRIQAVRKGYTRNTQHEQMHSDE